MSEAREAQKPGGEEPPAAEDLLPEAEKLLNEQMVVLIFATYGQLEMLHQQAERGGRLQMTLARRATGAALLEPVVEFVRSEAEIPTQETSCKS